MNGRNCHYPHSTRLGKDKDNCGNGFHQPFNNVQWLDSLGKSTHTLTAISFSWPQSSTFHFPVLPDRDRSVLLFFFFFFFFLLLLSLFVLALYSVRTDTVMFLRSWLTKKNNTKLKKKKPIFRVNSLRKRNAQPQFTVITYLLHLPFRLEFSFIFFFLSPCLSMLKFQRPRKLDGVYFFFLPKRGSRKVP